MAPRDVGGLLLIVGGCLSALGCAAPQTAAPPAAPPVTEAEREKEPQGLDERRIQLEKQLLSDLRKLRAAGQASAGGAEPSPVEEDGTEDCELLIFGGPIREIFLGCLSDESRADSIFNLKGEHGSDLSPLSLRNKFAPYGSNHDDTSACNVKAKHPPVVVSSDGKSLGLLTVNPALDRRIKTASVSDWLLRMCGI